VKKLILHWMGGKKVNVESEKKKIKSSGARPSKQKERCGASNQKGAVKDRKGKPKPSKLEEQGEWGSHHLRKPMK